MLRVWEPSPARTVVVSGDLTCSCAGAAITLLVGVGINAGATGGAPTVPVPGALMLGLFGVGLLARWRLRDR